MIEYTFILTAQFPRNGCPAVFTYTGNYNVQPGATRSKALKEILSAGKQKCGIPENTAVDVLFFSFEPNQLGGAV